MRDVLANVSFHKLRRRGSDGQQLRRRLGDGSMAGDRLSHLAPARVAGHHAAHVVDAPIVYEERPPTGGLASHLEEGRIAREGWRGTRPDVYTPHVGEPARTSCSLKIRSWAALIAPLAGKRPAFLAGLWQRQELPARLAANVSCSMDSSMDRRTTAYSARAARWRPKPTPPRLGWREGNEEEVPTRSSPSATVGRHRVTDSQTTDSSEQATRANRCEAMLARRNIHQRHEKELYKEENAFFEGQARNARVNASQLHRLERQLAYDKAAQEVSQWPGWESINCSFSPQTAFSRTLSRPLLHTQINVKWQRQQQQQRTLSITQVPAAVILAKSLQTAGRASEGATRRATTLAA